MLKLKPTLKNYIWGGKKFATLYNRDNNGDKISESWEVSVHPDGMSIANGKSLLEYISQTPCCVDKANSPFPILIKYIDAAQNLSVQVHPNDEYAQRVEGDNGKTEMWYIIDAEPNVGIYCGFKQDTTKQEFLAKVQDGTVEELLNFIPVHKGDCFLIEAGTVHAIGTGCVICEVQQSSNVTYRVYDYNRLGIDGKPRPLHVDKAVQVINFNKFEDHTNSGEICELACGTMQLLTSCKYFTCHKLLLNNPIEFTKTNNDSFTTLNVINGSGKINDEPFVAGDSFFIPRGEKFILIGSAEIILTTK
ncbi:MAG: class I mannose-6-phosphate isomerase [Clostridia bacterium]|nr:class I mannose-6-phosphate isomerase [Clostridia bacterium]